MQRLRRALVGTAVACLAVPLGIGSAVAHDDDDDDDDALEVEVIATGLDSPRGLALDRRENVWIAQAGSGGTTPCIPGLGPPGSTPRCLGATGKVSVLRENDDDDDRRDRRGRDDDHDDDGYTVHDVVTGLASLAAAGAEAIGPSDVTFDRRGRLLATIGLGADPTFRTTLLADAGELAAQLATVQRVNVRAGTTSLFADIGAFELAEDPDAVPPAEDPDSNPNSIAVIDGVRYVADAGGNTLLGVDRDGLVGLVNLFDPVLVTNPFGPGQFPADPVPNSVVRGPDGAIYVGLLTGFPFEVGAASVWRFEEGEDPVRYATGFTNIIDLAFDDDDNLLVLEIDHDGLPTGEPPDDPTGALIQVSRQHPTQHTILLTEPLIHPGGMVVDDDDVYISNNTVTPDLGEILKVELDD